MNKSNKKRIITAINIVVPLKDYDYDDFLFGMKYSISATDMVYVLKELSKDFHFDITDEFVDAIENVTFAELENLLVMYEDTAIEQL